ncbi:putative Ig domain-containing protein, partial [Larkinella sp. C7]|uniref:putative Ig domain-containing protein n=1 Tax=Larkinella sp. C7 TaxID=2576607 RepID=UPI001E59E908
FRQDLLNAGKGNGKHAFSFPIPANLKDGQPHLLTARVSGSSFMLKNPPKALTCQGSGGPINQPPVAPTTSPLSATIGNAFNVVLPAFTDPENQSLTYSLSGLPSGLSFTASSRQI